MKVFTNTGISTTSMTNTDMRNIKRYQSQSKGKFLGYKGNIHKCVQAAWREGAALTSLQRCAVE